VRDKNGEIELGNDPPTPPADGPDAEAALDRERERQRLAEAVKQYQIDRAGGVPPQAEDIELLEAVKASLRAKVAALSEDNWMFEREDPPRLL